MSLREVVSHIIEDLDVSDVEEEMANTVHKVEEEEIFREGKERFQCCKGAEYFGLIKPKSFSGDLQGKIRLYCALDAGDNLSQVVSDAVSISRQAF